MSGAELAELARLDAAATAWPWQCVADDDGFLVEGPVGVDTSYPKERACLGDLYGHKNAALIVAARNAIPKLLRDIHDLDRFARRVLHVAESMDWDANTGWNGIADAIGSLPPDLYETLGGGKE